MNEDSEVSKLYRRKERLRDVQEKLAPARAGN